MDSIYDDKDVVRAIEDYHKWKNFLMRDDIFTLLESIDANTPLSDIKQMTPDECVQERLNWIRSDTKYRDSAIEQAEMIWDLIGRKETLINE